MVAALNLLKKLDEDMYEIIPETPYIYNGNNVPRVTNILSDMLHIDALMGWSNYLGFKRQKYSTVLDEAAQKGSYTHNSIENYVQNNLELDINSIPVHLRNDVNNAYGSFKLWWDIISQNSVKVIFQEKPLVCQWFGGTLDILLEINGKIYLFDFKTSNHPNYKYFLQLSAYRYMLKLLYNIDIDGCGIIMLNKNSVNFEEIIASFDNEWDKNFIDHCQETFFSLVYSYYNKLRVELDFKELLKRAN
jgi:hypothetical protein